MIDPFTAVALATTAYKAIKQGVAVGRDLQDMGSQLSQWGKAVSDFGFAEQQHKNPPWYNFKSTDTYSAIEIFAQKRKLEEMREEIRSFISWNYGPQAWQEVLQIEADMRKQRKNEVYKKAKLQRLIIDCTLGTLIVLSGILGVAFVIFILGKHQGKW
jgi:hypothetical protein